MAGNHKRGKASASRRTSSASNYDLAEEAFPHDPKDISGKDTPVQKDSYPPNSSAGGAHVSGVDGSDIPSGEGAKLAAEATNMEIETRDEVMQDADSVDANSASFGDHSTVGSDDAYMAYSTYTEGDDPELYFAEAGEESRGRTGFDTDDEIDHGHDFEEDVEVAYRYRDGESHDHESRDDDEESDGARDSEDDIDEDAEDDDIDEDDDEEDEDDGSDDNDEEAEATGFGANDYSFMSSDRRGAHMLRELLQRNQAGVGASQNQRNIFDVMQRLVDGLDGPSFGRQHSEFDALIENLCQRDDTYLILESANELSEKLLMMDGMTAERVIQPSLLSKALVDILTDPSLADDLELHLVACRCLYNFIEVNTDFVHDALNCGTVETLVTKLLNIVYIDLTEQCLQTLEIVSRDRGSHSLIIASDGLRACLQNLDFLTVHSQRKCLQIVANACEGVSEVYFEFVLDQFQGLVAVAKHHDDATVKKSAWLGVSRIIDSFRDKPDFLEKLFSSEELLSHMLTVIRDSCNPSNTEVGLNFHSMISLLKSLIILISTSVKISNLLLNLGIGEYIRDSLNKFKKGDDAKLNLSDNDVSMESLISCPKELLSLLLNVITYLCPITYTPDDSPFMYEDASANQVKNRINYDRNMSYRNENSTTFEEFVHQVWPVLVGSFQATMDFSVRKQALVCLSRVVFFSNDTDMFAKKDLESLLGILTSIVSGGTKFVSKATELTSTADRSLNVPILLLSSAASIIHNLLLKSQLSFTAVFEREGVFSDFAEITQKLAAAGITCDETENAAGDKGEAVHRRSSLTTAYQEKYADKELFDYSQRLNTVSILKFLMSFTTSISELHEKFAESGDSLSLQSNKLSLISISVGKLIESSTMDFSAWESLWRELSHALSSSEGGVSSFEIGSSGVLGQLIKVFHGTSISKECRDVATHSFMDIFYGNDGQIRKLISVLQDSLARVESFEVISSGVHNSGNSEGGSASLAKQIKLRLVPVNDPATDTVPGNEQVIVSVHAIATFRAIEKFLKQRIVLTGTNGVDEDPEKASSEVPAEQAKTQFFINDMRISRDATIFGAVFRSLRTAAGFKKVESLDIWSKPFDVKYTTVPESENSTTTFSDDATEPIDAHVESILNLLKALFLMNEEVERSKVFAPISSDAFMNWKLTVKLNRQLEEPLVVAGGAMPGWSMNATKQFPFIFPLSTRMFFLQSLSFGHSRLIHSWNTRAIKEKAASQNENNSISHSSTLSLGAPSRKKIRLSREKIFKGAIKVLQQFGSQPSILEIEYFDEVGSGLGPTLEFYASVSKAFCKKDLMMWGQTYSDDGYASNTQGLFPGPIKIKEHTSGDKSVLYLFCMLGIFVARALLDSRIIDFNFNIVFISLIQNPNYLEELLSDDEDISASIKVLNTIDSGLGRSMQHLIRYLDLFNGSPDDEFVEVDGMTLSDLSLYFNVPGYENLDLVSNGSKVAVTPNNLESYIRKATKFLSSKGVSQQVACFRKGFSSVFPIESLSIFTPKELKEIFGSGEEDWSKETLFDSIKANHGFTQDSRAIGTLVSILHGLSKPERREFLQFLTGSPRLPIGGFKAMRPEFTVVRKHPEGTLSDDDYLPSVMTCANYLKLPDYTSEALMKSKLMHAIREGAGAFHLS